MATTKKKAPKDFESAVKRLEELTDQLESGELQLEQSIELYGEGLDLAGFCNQKLTEAEKKIKLISSENGRFTEVDFEPGGNGP